jgi:uncharacterized damage-inducible protein DinB
MELISHYKRLHRYNEWANNRYLDLWESSGYCPERIQLLLSHVLVAQKLWLTRIRKNPDFSLDIWATQPLSVLRELSKQNTLDWLDYLETASSEGLAEEIAYTNFQNLPYVSSALDIMTQCINHATYHRAQYALILRGENIAPPNTDFITFSRIESGQLSA